MDLVSFVNICDVNSNLNRTTVSLKNKGDCVSWKVVGGSDISLEYTVDSETTTVDNLEQVCLVNDGENVDVYINYKVRYKLVKLDLESITNFSF